jgi:uncharacterized protein YkwD
MMAIRRVVAPFLIVLAFCGAAYGETSASRVERELLALVNQARRAYGLTPLRWNEALATAAHRHAEVMAERGSAQHDFAGEPGLPARVKRAGASFHWLSENVAQGSSPQLIHAQFMKSAKHYANILDRDMDSIGIGVVERRRQWFVVEDFSQAR